MAYTKERVAVPKKVTKKQYRKIALIESNKINTFGMPKNLNNIYYIVQF